MKQLKIFMFILLAITIFSCYSTNTDCDDNVIENGGDIIWERAGGSLPNSNIVSWRMTVASDGNIWAYSAGTSNGSIPSELYLSTDNGDTWNKKSNTPSRNSLIYGVRLQVNPINGLLFLAGDYANGGLFRSNSNGATWVNIMYRVRINGFFITASGEIYVGCQEFDGVSSYYPSSCYYSNDNGNTWIEKSNGLPDRFAPLDLGTDGILYAGSNSNVEYTTGSHTGVYRSTDGGVT